MQTGVKISLGAHGLLIGWAFIGGWFNSDPLPLQVQEVSLISAAEFERLSSQRAGPEVSDAPGDIAEPEAAELPEVPTNAATPPEVQIPEPVNAPPPDPIVEDRPEPLPEPEFTTPQVAVDTPDPLPSLRPTLRPDAGPAVDRVAPVPVAPPPPDAAPDEVEQPAVVAEDGASDVQEPQDATAPEAASDRIVTEENEGDAPVASAAPQTSLRPRLRPRTVPAREAVRETVQDSAPAPSDPADDIAAAVGDAVAEAIAGGADVEAPEPSGPPLTHGEKEGLRVAVSGCWNVGSLSSEALRTTVVVGFSVAQDGKPDTGSIRLLSSTGGSGRAERQAYEAARRAIIRCGGKGFDLPPEKYAQWRDIEITFNPERMRIR
ncbi:energy transducer TonB [Epibacterium sp. SM1969]|uniref:Energy transducer TonB n=1 Tax=Tritonibacter aquimaris TaxID=2663379 RepID=A0A844AUH7_9RHOB|nr:energy transducer TonB [Tritonibacter aquimaris]